MQDTKTTEKINLDLVRIMTRMWYRLWAVMLVMGLFGFLGFALSYWVMEPQYRATAMLYVNNSTISVGSTSVNLSDLSASQSLVKTYIVILKTRRTLNTVREEAGLSYTYKELLEMIDAESESGTEVFHVTVTSKYPDEASNIANTIVKVLPDKIAEIVDGSSVRTVDFAVTPSKRSGPNVLLFTVAGVLAGFCLCLLTAVIREYRDDLIHSPDMLQDVSGVPLLAVIPDLMAQGADVGYGYGKKR